MSRTGYRVFGSCLDARQQAEALKGDFLFETWEYLADGRIVTRFATS
ncbi:MAG: hypothetical protein K6G08_00165 [Prevotella sp.]|nr:hypothetical protein [Prevotella sp.]